MNLSMSVPESVKSAAATLAIPSAQQAGLATLDIVGRTVEVTQETMRDFKKVVDEVIPGTVRFLGAFLLPEALNHPLQKITSLATRTATTVVVRGLEVSAETLSFGAPSWLKAARSYLASSNEILKGEWRDSTELLARCFAENCDRPLVRSELLNYIGLRKQLSDSVKEFGEDAPQTDKVREVISRKELVLQNYQDFKNLQSIFENGLSYVENHHDDILKLAESTADRIISASENYYTNHLGSIGSKLKCSWSEATSDTEKISIRNELRDSIAIKLKEVFVNALNEEEVHRTLLTASSALMSSFGVYKQALSGAGYAAFGAAFYSGGLAALTTSATDYALYLGDSTLNYLGSTIQTTVSNTAQYAWDSTFGYLGNCIHDGGQIILSRLPWPMRMMMGIDSAIAPSTVMPSTIPLPVDSPATVQKSFSATKAMLDIMFPMRMLWR